MRFLFTSRFSHLYVGQAVMKYHSNAIELCIYYFADYCGFSKRDI